MVQSRTMAQTFLSVALYETFSISKVREDKILTAVEPIASNLDQFYC